MSKIVDIENALNALIESTLPGYVMLSDAYDTPDNINIHLEKGYSTGFGSAIRGSSDFCKGDVDIQRVMVVALTNVYAPNLDASNRQSLEQSLMNDHFSLIGAIECNPTLNGNCSIATYTDDQGIEYVTDDRKQYIVIFTNILIRYIERVV